MPQYKIKIKTTFISQGIKGEKGMEVDLVSNQTSGPNLLSAGSQEIIEAFKRKYGLTFGVANISNNYLEVTKL